MRIPNPFALRGNLGLSVVFLAALVADIRTLLEPDLPPSPPPVSRTRFTDAAAYAHATQAIALQWRFAVVRQAVGKAFIRESLWARLGLAYRLFAFVVAPSYAWWSSSGLPGPSPESDPYAQRTRTRRGAHPQQPVSGSPGSCGAATPPRTE